VHGGRRPVPFGMGAAVRRTLARALPYATQRLRALRVAPRQLAASPARAERAWRPPLPGIYLGGARVALRVYNSSLSEPSRIWQMPHEAGQTRYMNGLFSSHSPSWAHAAQDASLSWH